MTKEHELQLLIDQRDVLDAELNRVNDAIRSLSPNSQAYKLPNMPEPWEAKIAAEAIEENRGWLNKRAKWMADQQEPHPGKAYEVYEADPGGGCFIPGIGWLKS